MNKTANIFVGFLAGATAGMVTMILALPQRDVKKKDLKKSSKKITDDVTKSVQKQIDDLEKQIEKLKKSIN